MSNRISSNIVLICFLVILSIFLSISCQAAVRYVRTDGDNTKDGSSWVLAIKSIQAAIDASTSGDEIWVAKGLYAGTYTLKAGISLYGGFAGNETSLEQRNWATNRTVADGDFEGSTVFTMPTGLAQLSRVDGFRISGANFGIEALSGLIIANNTISANIVHGIVVNTETTTKCQILNNFILSNMEDGISCYNASPFIYNNTIAWHPSSSGSGVETNGNSSPTLVNNIIAFNSRGYYRSSSGMPIFRNNCVYGNTTNFYGPSDPTGTNGNISQNPLFANSNLADAHINPGSPCMNIGDSSVVQPDWKDIDCQARIQGGVIDIGADESDGSTSSITPIVVRVSETGDDANDGSSWTQAKKTIRNAITAASTVGGEVWVKAGTYKEINLLRPYVSLFGGFAGTETERSQRNWHVNQTIIDAEQKSTAILAMPVVAPVSVDGFTIQNGKGSYGGAILCGPEGTTYVSNNLLVNNAGESSDGGALYCLGPVVISNNVIAGNRAFSSTYSERGGGISVIFATATIVNNTIVRNVAENGGGISLSLTTTTPATVANNIIAYNTGGIHIRGITGAATVSNNCVYGNTGYNYYGIPDPTGTNGNISADPKLASLTSDMHIQADSPCVDAGDSSKVGAGWVDMDLQARIQGSAVDIGADESDGTTWIITPSVIRVSTNGDDANDGSSWALAKKTIQAGINALPGAGGEVWVKAGTYLECINLRANAWVYGGFNGTETNRSQRNWKQNVTVIDGDNKGAVVTSTAGHLSSTVDGFTICNSGTPLQQGNREGIYCYKASPIIANNTIVSNATGIYCMDSFIVACNNVVAGNSYMGIQCSNGAPTFVNNTVVGNCGNAVHLTSCPATLVNNIIAFNNAGINGKGAAYSHANNVYGNCGYDVTGWTSPAPAGNISVDPKFVHLESGDYHIQPDSPCRDVGDSSMLFGMVDIDGESRVQNSAIDIGADESDGNFVSITPLVLRVRPDGNDSADGSTWESAKKTIQAAINALPFGGEVWVKKGIYQENISIGKYVHLYGGFAGSEVDRNARDWKLNTTMIQGVQPSEGPGAAAVTMAAGSFASSSLDGFMVKNGSPGISCGAGALVQHNTIISNLNHGIVYTPYALILYNTISGNKEMGIACGNGAAFAMIANNVITGNGTSGIGKISTDGSPAIRNNAIVANGTYGIQFYGTTPGISNNIIAFNAYVKEGTNVDTNFKNNCIYGQANESGFNGINGNIVADPKFLKYMYGDLHIHPESPCRNAGYNATVAANWLDIDDEARIQEGLVDIGADEINGTVWIGSAIIVRVSPDGNDANDGSSWASAKKTVQAGLDAASHDRGQVWVKAGRYREAICIGAFAHLYGGFNGTETSASQRNPRLNQTTLDGEQSRTVVLIQSGQSQAVIDGFDICNGSGTDAGGIYSYFSSPTISNNFIYGCYSKFKGAGVYYYNGNPTIYNNIIAGNSGSGIYCWGINEPDGSILSNTIVGNHGGSGALCFYSGTPSVVNNIIAFNGGSGVHKYNNGGASLFRNNCVYGNYRDYGDFVPPQGVFNPSEDPQFASLAFRNLHIQPTSPCRDAGDGTVLDPTWKDMDGQGRIHGSAVDIGADESDGTNWTATKKIIHVTPEGSDTNSGDSWTRALKTVQAGINAAAAAGGEVWVKVGDYHERVTLLPFVTLAGGFSGNETSGDGRVQLPNPTALDGDGNGSVVTIHAGWKLSSILDVTIRNGNAEMGGGIKVESSTVTLFGNRITENRATRGAGIYLYGATETEIIGNVVDNNTSVGYGAGIYCDGSLEKPKLISNTIVGNTSTSSENGAGIFNFAYNPTIANNLVAYNSSSIYLHWSGITTRNNCYYANNPDHTGNVTSPDENGNFSADPMLVSWETGNIHLKPGSPCIDTGNNDFVPIHRDIDWGSRTIGSAVDIGADEFIAAAFPIQAYSTPASYVKFGRWNCVAVPADPVNANPLSVFSGVDVPNTSFQFWKNHVDGGGFQSYGELFGWTGPIQRGTPYWFLEVGAGSDKALSYEGYVPTADFVITIPPHVTVPCWVMIGTPFATAVSAENVRFRNVAKRGDTWLTWQDAFSESNPNLRIVESNVQGWDAALNRFVGLAPTPWLAERTQFEPWMGYWMLVYDVNELKIRFPKP